MRIGRPGIGIRPSVLIVAAGLVLFGAMGTRAENFGLGLDSKDGGKPIDIEAEQGIEWQQNNHVYIARGNAKATRGQTSVNGETLTAFYRPAGDTAGGKDAKGKNAPAKNKNATAKGDKSEGSAIKSEDPISGNSTEIYRLEADGNVRIVTATQTVYGDHAVYDVDQAVVVVTGKNLKMETKRDIVTARDSLEWYDKKQLAVARGNAVAVREGKRVRGDVLTAEVEKQPPEETSHIGRIDAQGNVLVSSQDQIARGDSGVYNVDTGIATLNGRVTLTRADNELRGQYAVVDLNNNVSRLLSAPPSAKLTEGRAPRVQGLLLPQQKPAEPKQ